MACGQDGVDLFCNGHFDLRAAGQVQGGCCAAYAFGDPAGRTENLLQVLAFAKLDPDRTVTAELARSCEDEVADACETGKRLATAAEGDGQARHFGKSARDERSYRVRAQFQAGANSRGNGDYVFHRAGNFRTD